MPTTRRRRVRALSAGALRPTVAHFLATGQIETMPGDNPWLTFALSDPRADQAHDLWQRGDREAALALLAQLPGRVLR